MNDQHGTLTIYMVIDEPTLAKVTKLRKVTLAKVHIPRSMVPEYVRDFKECNKGLCEAYGLRGTFTPETEDFSLALL